MIKFGPSGNSLSFFEEGYTSTLQTAKWLCARNLDIFEYSFGRGANIGEVMARAIGNEFQKYGIGISVHAPYYINFANPDDSKAEASFKYLLDSMRALEFMGGNRCIFHIGSEGKALRAQALDYITKRLKTFLEIKKVEGYDNIIICPETMGKYTQIGSIEEICDFVLMDDSIYPCVDFGHLNCRMQGALNNVDAFENIIKYMLNRIGEEKTKYMHVHFSKIEFSAKGEVRHLTFADDKYGPEFEPFAEVLAKYGLQPWIISESAGTQAEDALTMKELYNALFSRLSAKA